MANFVRDSTDGNFDIQNPASLFGVRAERQGVARRWATRVPIVPASRHRSLLWSDHMC